MSGANGWSAALANEAIIMMAGHETYARGLVYARRGNVSGVEFDAATKTLTASVLGSGGNTYRTVVGLNDADPRRGSIPFGRCGCPVARNCKHAVAVLITARGLEGLVRSLDRPEWEQILTRLSTAPDPTPADVGTALGLEFEVHVKTSYRGQGSVTGMAETPSLRARPVRRNKSGGWVRGGISWDELDARHLGYPQQQQDLLLQIRFACGPMARYVYGRSPWISFDAVAPRIWSLLEAAPPAGLELISQGGRTAVGLPDDHASARLDARRLLDGSILLSPVIMVGEVALGSDRVGLLGEPAHGMFAPSAGLGRNSDPMITLLRLAQPLPRELRQLIMERRSVDIPAADADRFTDEFYPQVRRKAEIVSTDGTVTLPEVAPPTPVLVVRYQPAHRLELRWRWQYEVAGATHRFDLDEPVRQPTVRDPAAETRIAAALPLPYDRMPELAASRRAGSGPAPRAELSGMAAAVFSSEVITELEQAGVTVIIEGERLDYRLSEAQPEVRVETTAESSDWFDLKIDVSIDGEQVPFEALFAALARGDEFLILETGVYLEIDRPEFARLAELIEEARTITDSDDEPGTIRVSRLAVSVWEELVGLGVVLDQSDRWATAVRGLTTLAEGDSEPPAGLHATMRPYQLDGYRWLTTLWRNSLGGILADDMGLGKTMQALALVCRVAQLAEEAQTIDDAPPFLVVAPTSVVGNWAREAATFAPGLRVVTVDKTEGKSRVPLAETIAGADLVITSYTLLRIDAESYAAAEWGGMILDEAQFVKNHRARTYAAARRVRCDVKLAITGTPLENSLMDLWSLFSIVAPGMFPHPDRFAEYYRRPIERGEDPERLSRLRRRIRPLMLRRTKESVALDLPPKIEQVLDVVLDPKQLRIYQTHLQRERQKVLGLVDDLDANRFTILSSITKLRQLSLDPSLVDPEYAGVGSSKIELLTEQLSEVIAEGHRALVFSQFTGFLGLIKERLDTEGLAYGYLDGSTRNRSKVIDSFTSGEVPIFLISLKAGGFGLNLTQADYVFVLDPWWNPATESQAVDRAHRIGQTRNVMVYRMVARDTIEEKVMALKARKAELFDSVLGDDSMSSAGLTADDIRDLFAA
ncbi:DEAD/DEAH box helicase [Microlunatus speluncae]|uniref:DEAD/DEAH box helicase n=1 Tax=Microlunatus speluncae TaxID=2594267 RepID=UPI001C2DBE6B|nr:DEAD/DEAH box helicase [Microlunatus speluncae]